jgi:hypothetical protein
MTLTKQINSGIKSMEIGMILIQMDENSKLSIILNLHIYTGRRAEGPSRTNINSIRMSVCLYV